MKGICWSLLIVLVAISNGLFARPEPIKPLSRAIHSLAYYQNHAVLWQAETVSNPKDAYAWLNYYTAARNVNALQGYAAFDLAALVQEVQTNIPNTFEAHYLTYWQSSFQHKDYSALLKAHAVAPERQEIIHDMMHYYLLQGDEAAYAEWSHKLYQSDYLSPGLLHWNYNALASVRENGVLITQGDNDTYPAWVLQVVKGVRTDVEVVNIYLLLTEEAYRSRVFARLNIPTDFQVAAHQGLSNQLEALLQHILQYCARPVHLGIATPAAQRTAFNSKLYLTGLAFEHSEQFVDNVRLIRQRFENDFLTDYLVNPLAFDPSQSVVDHLNMNYVPALALLYDLYEIEGSEKATDIQQLALDIAERAGKTEEVEVLFQAPPQAEAPTESRIDLREIDKQLQQVDGALYASAYEVSNGLYQAFLHDLVDARRFDLLEKCEVLPVDWRSLLPEDYRNLPLEILYDNGDPHDPNAPIVNLSHEASTAFLQWLTEIYNRSDHRKKRFKKVAFRLPTVEEWEQAAIGGSRQARPYPWGGPYNRNAKGCFLANFNPYLVNLTTEEAVFGASKQESVSPGDDGGFFPVVVDAYFPNAINLYNMAGNVAEMVQEEGLTKGGGWLDPSYYMQIEVTKEEAAPSPNVGFRIFMEVIEE